MKVINIAVSGQSPLIMHKFTDSAQIDATLGSRTAMTATERGTPREQAEAFLYTDPGGNIIMPQQNIFQCIISAGRFFKAGKSKITTLKSSLIPACATIPVEYVKLDHDEPWEVDSRPVRIPSTGGRIVRHRPKFENWSFSFPIELDDEDITIKLFREIVDTAGRKVGLCDFRPECRGPYGRFAVTHWEVDEG